VCCSPPPPSPDALDRRSYRVCSASVHIIQPPPRTLAIPPPQHTIAPSAVPCGSPLECARFLYRASGARVRVHVSVCANNQVWVWVWCGCTRAFFCELHTSSSRSCVVSKNQSFFLTAPGVGVGVNVDAGVGVVGEGGCVQCLFL